MIKTSVIIPVYNVEKYLDKCVESVLQQTQKEIEIILVDDGSTDGSKEKVQLYEKNYPCIKAVFQENHKLGAARNTGVSEAEGKYIYFLDSDDYVDSFLLEKCYTRAEKDRLDALMFDSTVFIDEYNMCSHFVMEEYDRHDLVEESKIFSGKEFWKKYYLCGGIYTNAYLFYINRQYFINSKLFFVPEIFYEDNDWVIRLYKSARRVMYLPEQLHYRRIHSGSIMTSEYSDIHLKSIIVVCKLHIDMLLNALDEDEMRMVLPRYIGMLHRFISIFKQFADQRMIYKVQENIKDLYGEIITEFHRIWKCDIQAGVQTLTTINLIRKHIPELREYRYGKIIEDIREIFDKFIEEVPLNRSVNVGVYGTGKRCSEFFDMYENLYGKPIANLFFIDSVQKSGFKFRNYIGYNICDINTLQLDMLLIASTMYGDQMEQSVREIIIQDIPIVRFSVFFSEFYKIIFG